MKMITTIEERSLHSVTANLEQSEKETESRGAYVSGFANAHLFTLKVLFTFDFDTHMLTFVTHTCSKFDAWTAVVKACCSHHTCHQMTQQPACHIRHNDLPPLKHV